MAEVSFTQHPANRPEQLRFLARDGLYYSIGRASLLAERIGMEALRAEAPKRTGRFAASLSSKRIFLNTQRAIRVEFYGPHPLALWITRGTRPHVILPVRAQALHFVVTGRDVFARRVNHPGTRPNPFHQRALAQIGHRMPRGFYGAVAEQLESL